jgi:ubiquinone/menaquinone biosynthesis C-methylase UbiE
VKTSSKDSLETELHERLRRLRLLLDLDQLEGQGNSNASICKYYKDSRLGYRLIHSRDGAMHMALNPAGEFDESGYAGQAHLVAEKLAPTTRDVLELAFGNGFNLELLARMRPDVRFTGIDLVPEQVKRADGKLRNLANASTRVGDFQDLAFPDAAFDLAFAIEGLCHAIDLPRALSEVHRVLRPGGRFVVVDGWRTDAFSQKSADLRTAATYAESAMAVSCARKFGAWKSAVDEAGFEIVEDLDVSDEIMPNLERLARVAEGRFVTHPLRARLLKRLLPTALVTNAVAGYLMPLTVQLNAHTYRIVVLTRPARSAHGKSTRPGRPCAARRSRSAKKKTARRQAVASLAQ